MFKHFIVRCCLLLATLPGFLHGAHAQSTPDPGILGPYTVVKAQYDLGDLAYAPPSFPASVEVRGSVHYPSALGAGPFPVLVFLHGRHSTCYRTSTLASSLAWPCPTGYQPITSYEGYDFLAARMASHGYIVISVSCNAINARDNSVADYGMQARAELMQRHLDLWNTYNTTGGAPFDTMFVGKLDMQNIGTMGHSRGGEGVIYHALHNQALGSPYGIKAVLTLAPVDFNRRVMNNIPLLNIAPYCDGDVSSLSGVHFYDDARYTVASDESPKHNILMMGANHNFFNTVWTPGSYIAGTSDDWDGFYSSSDVHCGSASSGSGRFDTTTQKAALLSYGSAFYRIYLGGEKQYAPILKVTDIVPPATSLLDSTNVFVSYHAGRTDRLDINRTDTPTTTTINTMSDSVKTNGLLYANLCGGGLTMPSCGITTNTRQEPHKGSTTVQGLAQMAMRWNDTTDYYENKIPATYQDLTYIDHFMFRASVNFLEASTDLNFTVQLIDSAGAVSSQQVRNHSHALFFQPGTRSTVLPKIMFNTINIPISSFTGINRKKVRKVRFLYNKMAGSILVSDLAFINNECGQLNATFTADNDTLRHVIFANGSTATTTDSVVRLWHFGNPASGTADTSTLKNPTHTYTAPGTYTACLYMVAFRPNGNICRDTFCTTLSFAPAAVSELTPQQQITIIPNPAKDYLYIGGAEPTDVLTLINLYGQELFSTTLAQPTVSLPSSLASGIYYAIVTTKTGRAYQRISILR